MESRTEVVPVQINNNVQVMVEATVVGSEEDVAIDIRPFQEVTDAIEAITSAMVQTLEKVKPDKASVEFGIEIAVQSGKLTTLIVQGSSKGNMKITLEWNKK
jgi:tetrahydromethanopterin S-methyltransferase subunit B